MSSRDGKSRKFWNWNWNWFGRSDDRAVGRQEVSDGTPDEDAGSEPLTSQRQHLHPQYQGTGHARRGFSMPVHASVPQLRPLLVSCTSGDGGVQGLNWFGNDLKIDEDGNVAHEFFDEILPGTSSLDDTKQIPRSTLRTVKIIKQTVSSDGDIQHWYEHEGNSRWI